MAFVPFSITIGTTPLQLDITAETDSRIDQAIEFDVGAADIYVGPDNQVSASAGAHRGRKYAAGTHVEMSLQSGEHLYAVTASGTSVVEGAQIGV